VRRVWFSILDRDANIDSLIVEFATVGKTKDGRIYHHLWGADEITTLLKEHDLARDESGADGDRIIS
jgi:20S proteasome subunit alpha 3